MGLFGALIGMGTSIALGALDLKFDVLFNDESEKENFFTLLNKWNEIFQRKNLLIDPKKENINISNKLEKIPKLKIKDVFFENWQSSNQKEFPDIAINYIINEKSLIVSLNYRKEKYTSITSLDIFQRSLKYQNYGIWWQPNNESELGLVFKCFNLNSDNDDLKSVLYLYFKNSETCISSSALLTIVKRGSDTGNHIFREEELGLERLLTILNRHDVYEHLQEFLKQPYSLSENRQKELEEQKRIETKKMALLEKMKKEKGEIIKKQEKIEQQQREEAERQAKLEAEKKQNDAINALNDL